MRGRSLRRPASDRPTLHVRTAASAAVLLCLAGCETLSEMNTSSPQKPAPAASSGTTTTSKAPAPRFNLTGYSAAFKQGYADACATPKRRNAERFKTDTDYSMGWQDGQSACRSR